MDLVEALEADRGVVCVVGAGGKKTTLYALADRVERAVVTATVRIPIFDERVADVVVTDDPRTALEDPTAWPLGVVPERERADRYRGYEPEAITTFGDDAPADVVLVKADGARTRLLKAPNQSEPQLPAGADTVIPIASAQVVGKPLDPEYVHRPERVAELTGLEEGDRIRPVDVATVLASENGGRKRVPAGATVVPVVNMVDGDATETLGRKIAAGVLARADVPRVVLTRMNASEPVVAVVD